VVDEGPGVVVRLMGGLGNQLFQFAAGCAVARERGRELFVYEDTNADFSRFIQSGLHPATKRMVDRLVLNFCERPSLLSRGLWELRAHVFKGDPRYFTFRQEDPFGGRDDERLFRHKGLLGMTGYFQNPEWYEPVLAEVLQALRDGVASVVRPGERSIKEEVGDYTALSFRRGDYLRLGWALPIDYYEAALKALPKSDGPLVLLSDDGLVANFAAQWFEAKGMKVIPDSVLGKRSRQRDLALLADASQVVMSNSTFCWWGTVLGDDSVERNDQTRFVVAPRGWIPQYPFSSCLLRPQWLAL
jgi:hypothetical protein